MGRPKNPPIDRKWSNMPKIINKKYLKMGISIRVWAQLYVYSLDSWLIQRSWDVSFHKSRVIWSVRISFIFCRCRNLGAGDCNLTAHWAWISTIVRAEQPAELLVFLLWAELSLTSEPSQPQDVPVQHNKARNAMQKIINVVNRRKSWSF